MMNPPVPAIVSSSPEGRKAAERGVRLLMKRQGVVNLFFWITLALFAYQTFFNATSWGAGWVVLGMLVLLLKQRCFPGLAMVIELPIFLAIVSYSVTTLYLAAESGAYDLKHDPLVNGASWVALGGMACFAAGLIWNVSKIQSSTRVRHSEVTVTRRQAVILYFAGLVCNNFLIHFAPASLWVVVYVFGFCMPLGLFTLLKSFTDAGEKWVGTWKFFLWLAAIVWWTLNSMLGGIFGSALLILFMLVSQYVKKSSLLLVAIMVIGAILAPLMQDTKSDYRQKLALGNAAPERALREVVSENFRKVFLEGDMKAYRSGTTKLAERLCAFDMFMRVKRHIDTNHDYAGGRTVKDALITGFTPRILWANKPITGGASDLAITYGDMMIAEGTSVGVGAISELYINGGTEAVLLGMFGLGCLAGFLLKKGELDRVQPLGSLMALLIFCSFVRPEVNLSDMLGGVIRMVFLWLVLRVWVLQQHRRIILAKGIRAFARI